MHNEASTSPCRNHPHNEQLCALPLWLGMLIMWTNLGMCTGLAAYRRRERLPLFSSRWNVAWTAYGCTPCLRAHGRW